MLRNISQNKIMWLMATCGLLIIIYLDSMWSWSVDLAHHYSLSYRLSEQWTFTNLNDPTLGEMNFYPRLSHIFAAIIGTFFNSTLIGIQITSLLSLTLILLCILLIFFTLRYKLAIISSLIFTILVGLNKLFFNFDIHGHEIINNFFFSQLVGHSVLFIGLLISIHIENIRKKLLPVAIFILLMIINAEIHLLPALEMLGTVMGLLLTFIFMQGKYNSIFSSKTLIAAILAVTAIVGIVLHPSFSAMRVISENNGDLHLNHISYPFGIISICILVLVTSLGLFTLWTRDIHREYNIAIKYISIYGAATSGLCLLQFILKNFGFGSDYAVKKYAFGIITILFIHTSIYIALFISEYTSTIKFQHQKISIFFNSFTIAILLIITFICIVPSKKFIDVSDIVNIEKSIIAIYETSIPAPDQGKSNAIIGLSNLKNTFNYMFSIAIAKTPREIAIPDLLINNKLSNFSRYNYIISSKNHVAYGNNKCQSLLPGVISAVNSSCLENELMSCKNYFDFSNKGFIYNELLGGFGNPENHGRWTIGHSAMFKCTNSQTFVKEITLHLTPFVYGRLKSQRIQIHINDIPVGDYNINNPKENVITLNIPESIRNSNISISFYMPDAISPRDLGFNKDERKLGFSIKSILLQ